MALVTGQAGSNESGNYFARGWVGVFHPTTHRIVCVALTHHETTVLQMHRVASRHSIEPWSLVD